MERLKMSNGEYFEKLDNKMEAFYVELKDILKPHVVPYQIEGLQKLFDHLQFIEAQITRLVSIAEWGKREEGNLLSNKILIEGELKESRDDNIAKHSKKHISSGYAAEERLSLADMDKIPEKKKLFTIMSYLALLSAFNKIIEMKLRALNNFRYDTDSLKNCLELGFRLKELSDESGT